MTKRAEDRDFKQSLEVATLIEKRSEILSALWALIQDWHNNAEPKPSRSNSSFPEWARIIGGIVENAGYGCPLETPQIEAAADVDGEDMRQLVNGIIGDSSLKTVRFNEVVEIAQAHGLFESILPESGEVDCKQSGRFGLILKRYDGRLIDCHRFTIEGKGRSRRYKVEINTNEN